MNPAKPQLPKWAIALMVVPFGITFYWMITYTGPYRYLAELQLKWFGEYVPKLTFLLIVLGWVLVGAVIGFLVRGAERPVASMQMPARVSAADVKPEIHVPEWFQRYFRLAGALALMGVGGWFYYNGTHTGGLQQLNALDFQSGKVRARVLYAQVRGHLSQQYLTDGSYLYIPMASEKNSTAPVQLVVGVNEHEMRKYLHREADGTFMVRGVADKGLLGQVKYAFEKNGTAVADPVWVVHAGRDPSWDKTMGLLVMGVGVLLGGALWALDRYRERIRAALKVA